MRTTKPFFDTYEFQVTFTVTAPSVRPKEKKETQTYNPTIPFDFKDPKGKVLFYDKLPKTFSTLDLKVQSTTKEKIAKKNVQEYLSSIVHPDDYNNPEFKIELTDITINKFKG